MLAPETLWHLPSRGEWEPQPAFAVEIFAELRDLQLCPGHM